MTLGQIIKVPAGTPVTRQEDLPVAPAYRRPVRQTRGVTFAVVEHITDAPDPDLGEGAVTFYTAAGKARWIPHRIAEQHIVTPADHRLHVGSRRVVGGSAVRGGGSVYSTDGVCACGARFSGTAREIRSDWRAHIDETARHGTFRITDLSADRPRDPVTGGRFHITGISGWELGDLTPVLDALAVGASVELDPRGIRRGAGPWQITRLAAGAA